MPLVSVVMPVYNSAKYLRESIESILNQTLRDFEFIIVDDGSVDDSLSIIKSYTDSRIVVIHKTYNSGIALTFNAGIAAAKGKYIARMDSDDISSKERLELQVKHMEANPDVIALGGAFKYMDSGKIFNPPITYEEFKVYSLLYMPIANPTLFFRKEIFEQRSLEYDKSFEPAEDYEMIVRIADFGRVENLSEVLLTYRTHPMQTTAVKIRNQTDSVERIRIRQMNKLLSFDDKPYDQLFAIRFLMHNNDPKDLSLLKNAIALLSDIYKSEPNFFSKEILMDYLHGSWLHFFKSLEITSKRKWLLFFSVRKNIETRITFKEALKLIVLPVIVRILK